MNNELMINDDESSGNEIKMAVTVNIHTSFTGYLIFNWVRSVRKKTVENLEISINNNLAKIEVRTSLLPPASTSP